MDWFQHSRGAARLLSAGQPGGLWATCKAAAIGAAPDAAGARDDRSGCRPRMKLVAAGVAQRGSIQTIRTADLATFIITYGGFIRRPCVDTSMEVARNYATVTIPQFKRNAPRKR